MRRFLKYIFLPLAVIFFWNCADKSVSAVPEDILSAASLESTANNSIVSEYQSEFCLPRQVSSANSHRVHNASRRAAGPHRSSIGFVKSGSLINAGIRYSVQRKSVIVHSSLVEPSHRLLYIGKLII